MQNYKIVDYIRISGIDKWFDTGIKCKLALTIKAKVISRLTTATWGPILGSAIEADKPSYYRISVPNTSTERIIFDCGSENQRIKNNQITSPLGVELEIVAKNGELTVNGKTTTVTPFTTEFALDRNFMIGNNRNTSSQNTDCEYYYLQLFDGEDLVFDGIPCVDADGTPAFYDKVTDRLIYAGGTSGTISNPKPHETFVYHVPKSADGTFTCNVKTNHSIQPKDYAFLGTSDSITIEDVPYFDANGAYTKVRCKYLVTNTSGGNHIGFNSSNIWRLFHYQASYAYFDCGGETSSYRHSISALKPNTIYDLTITNSSIYNNDTQSYIGQWTQAPIPLTHSNKLQIGSGIRVFEVDCYDGADNLIASLRPKQYDATQWGLYDSVNDKWYAVGKGEIVNYWKDCKSIDFGGADVVVVGQRQNPIGGVIQPLEQSTSVESITNGNLADTQYAFAFNGCTNLKTFNLTIPNATGTYYNRDGHYSMFRGCSSLSNFTSDISFIENANAMFKGCTSLKTINCQLPLLKDGSIMFAECGIEEWTTDMPLLSNGRSMFTNCKSLRRFDAKMPLLKWADYGSTHDKGGYNSYGYGMFQGCSALTSFTSNLNSLENQYGTMLGGLSMFKGCTNLQTADLGNTTMLTGNTDMFNGLAKLENVTMSLNSVTAWNNMFKGCTNLTNWNIKDLGIETSTLLKPKVTSFDYIANNAKTVTNGEWFVMTDAQFNNYPNAVATLQGKGWNVYTESTYPQDKTSKYAVRMGEGTFTLDGTTYRNNLEGVVKWIDLPNSISSITSVGNAFSGKTNIYDIVIDLPNVTNGASMMRNCTALTSFSGSLSGLVSGGTNTTDSGMCQSCSSLTTFETDNLDNLIISKGMFRATNLQSFDYCMNRLVRSCLMFQQESSQDKLKSFDGSMNMVEHTARMFRYQKGLTSVVTSMPNLISDYTDNGGSSHGYMFSGCTALTDLRISRLPVNIGTTLNLTQSPVNYDSFVYMALVNPKDTYYTINTQPTDGEWIISDKKASNIPIGYYPYKSNSNYHVQSSVATLMLTFTGKGTYDIYINSYAESSFDYTTAYELDGSTTEKATTKSFQYNPTGTVESNYKKVTYVIADNAIHTAKITYRKDGSYDKDDDRGYVLIPNSVAVATYNGDKCTLQLSNDSKALSATTDVHKYWNLLVSNGYRISGYTATDDLPTVVNMEGDEQTIDLSSDEQNPTNIVFGVNYVPNVATIYQGGGYTRLVNATDGELTITIGDQTITIAPHTMTDVLNITSPTKRGTITLSSSTADNLDCITVDEDQDNNNTNINI